ncbi:aldose epimerase family protein [Flavobacterium agrisoli]|uniref:Aldose 1-epimerase n=1 Tax=Flavobacterium agrisoli TaxID=2793066 RepID=A0A934UJG0_9FLAO|nr:aldose epimerase family protein [Flavobacterium agrisoli]MBK0369375.1 galactose mutarotase [Flavobacterium agrisoli]
MNNVKEIIISNTNGMKLTISTRGATIIRLQVPNSKQELIDVVVGLQNANRYLEEPYLSTPLYLGSSVGRYAGRISGGSFTIEGIAYPVEHTNGVHLHGGKNGLSEKNWKVKEVTSNKMVLTCFSPHLEEGYPGNLNVGVTYFIDDENRLKITYQATTDAATVINLTNHAYFNLEGSGTILNHELQINSDAILEVDERLIPSGKLVSVSDTVFDVRKPTTINRPAFQGYDDTFVLQKDSPIKASLASAKTNIRMNVYTNQPASVVYTPKEFGKLPFIGGTAFETFPAICFETQNFPDAPNHENFPSALLIPGEKYTNESIFEFTSF